MSLIIALGSNLGDRLHYLKQARWILSSHFELVASSQIYESKAVDLTDQPNFLNQVIEFKRPSNIPAEEILKTLLLIENFIGRVRSIPKGPRCIDIDLIFIGTEKINTPLLTVPHPRWSERSFVVRPLSELPFYRDLVNRVAVKDKWEATSAYPLSTSY